MDIDHVATDELEHRCGAVAQQMSTTASALEFPEFSGAGAGRDYTECGNALAGALDGLRRRMVDRAQFIEDLGIRIGGSARAIVDIDEELIGSLRSADRMSPDSRF